MTEEQRRTRRSEANRRLREAVDRKAEDARALAEEDSLAAPERRPKQMSVRAKSSGHRKKTADKWKQ
jgi:hypothetical protein